MFDHTITPRTVRGSDGRIVLSGVSWDETSPWLEDLLLKLVTLAVFAFVVGLIWAFAARELNPALIGGLVGGLAAFGLLVFMPGASRSVYFHADGRMETPNGIAHRPFLHEIGGSHAHIVSIEARPQHNQPGAEGGWERMFEVVFVSAGGDLIYVSRNLREWGAFKVAAQLNQSLAAIRREAPDAGSVILAAPVD